jgi:hypothetical protein
MTEQVLIAEPGEHSDLGPSSSDRWLNCPGSVKASKGVKKGDTVYSAEGTAAHLLSEEARKANRPVIDWLGWKIKVGTFTFEVDEAMADAVQEFVDQCEEMPGAAVFESRVQYERWVPGGFGTNDDTRLAEPMAVITDLKFGRGHQVFAKDNSQLKLYALGILEDYGYLYDIKSFKLFISQPRLDHRDEWEISSEDLIKWADERLPRAMKEIEEGTKFAAGSWCAFCPIRKTCAVRANSVTQLMLREGEFEDLDNLETHALRAQNRLQFITNDQIAKILPALGDFTKWIADVKSRAVSALIAKEEVGGWKLVNGRSTRKWKDEANAALKLKTLEVEPYKPAQVISVAVAEKELGKKEFGQRFKLSEDFLKPAGKPVLAPADDKRAAMDTSSINEFDNLDDEE